MFQHATLSGDALDYIETLLLDTPGPVPSDHRALSLYALLYQARGGRVTPRDDGRATGRRQARAAGEGRRRGQLARGQLARVEGLGRRLARCRPAAPSTAPEPPSPALAPRTSYQVHGFVGFTHQRLPNGLLRLGWVRATWRAAVRAAVLGRGGSGGGAAGAPAEAAVH
jgi:hypothetical protein